MIVSRTRLLILLVCCCASFSVQASESAAYIAPRTATVGDPLFESQDTLSITLQAPFSELRREDDKQKSYKGQLTHADRSFAVSLSVRGNKRLKTCRNPPLWVDFDKKEIDDTLFDKQKHIKLVVQCDRQDKYTNYLRGEYLVYRMLNVLTDSSYRVRWVEVNYVDGDDEWVQPAFFIERKPRLAKRLDYKKNDRPSIRISELSAHASALADLFQFVVANADYSFLQGPDPDDDCCHNAKLFMDEGVGYVPVPYDFDSSGIVNTNYAEPNEALGIRSVTQRVYRGFCRYEAETLEARRWVLDHSDELSQLFVDDPVLSKRKAASMEKYLRRSLSILEDDKDFNRSILRKCRG